MELKMANHDKPSPPFDTIEKRIERIEYLVYRMCVTMKIDYDLN